MPPTTSSPTRGVVRLAMTTPSSKTLSPAGKLGRIRVSGQTDAILTLPFQRLADLAQDIPGTGFKSALLGVEHRAILLIDNLDTQTFRRDIEHHLFLGTGPTAGFA